MKCYLSIFLLIIPLFGFSQDAGLYDMNGNRLYYLVDNGKKHAVDENGKKIRPDPAQTNVRYYNEKDLISSSGKTYYFDYGWDQIILNDKVLIEYNFNRRRYEWVEHQNIAPKGRTDSKDAARIYTNFKGFKSPEHGELALLTYDKGIYYNEFGKPVYQLKGRFPGWCGIVMFHDYYQEYYTGTNLDSMLALRKPYQDSINNAFKKQNTLAIDMLNLGNKYKETLAFMDYYNIVYFTMVDGKAKAVDETKLVDLENDWIVVNEQTRRNTTPFEMPAAGHYTKKKDAKKMGLQLPTGPVIIWEIKVKPEFQDNFQASLGY